MYFQVKVEFEQEIEVGKKVKTVRKQYPYLVDAMSVTEAEARVTKYLVERGERDFEVKSAQHSKIVEVISVEVISPV